MTADPSGRGPERGPERHDLLIVAPANWPAVIDGCPHLPSAAEAAVRRWAEAGWPVVARRPAPGDAAGAVPVGLPLPPGLGKARLALAIPAGVPWRAAPPVTLAEAGTLAPTAWRGAVGAVLDLAGALGLAPRVFGSLMWQARTGLPYLQPSSDLDLLWPVEDAATVGPLLDGLGRIAEAAPMAVDGEILAEVGGLRCGVQWRELEQARRVAGGVVLAKSLDRAALVPAGTILGRSTACS